MKRYRRFRCPEFALAMLLAVCPLWARPQSQPYLTSSEVNKLRDAQDPSQRIKVYVSFQQKRLELMEAASDANGDVRQSFDELLNQYIDIDNEMKNWIQYQYNRDGDMRKGLRLLLDQGPKQLEILRHFQNSPSPAQRGAESSLHDAIADMNDTLNGATQALAAQQKKFPAMKQASKAEAKELKKQRKEQEKLNRKERKMRNKHRKQQNQDGSGGN